MGEKVAVVGVTREDDYLYYVSDGAVWKIPRGRHGVQNSEREKVAEGGFEMDPDYTYFLDAEGDVSREVSASSRRRAARLKRKAAADLGPEVANGHHGAAANDQEIVGPDEGHGITRGLQIKKVPIDQILAGTKTWEIRGTATSRRGSIALIESRSGHVVGTCELVDVVGPLSLEELQTNEGRTGFRPDTLYYEKSYAWVLRNAHRLSEPIPYRHPHGAVIWVKLDPSVVRSLGETASA